MNKEKSNLILPILLAGGEGTRVNKYISDGLPKQFSNFFGKKTLFEQTLLRFSDDRVFEKPIVITNEKYKSYVKEQSNKVSIELSEIVCEPVAKNTAVSCMLGSHLSEKIYGEKLVIVTPTDHLMKNFNLNEKIIDIMIKRMQSKILLIGVIPKYCSSEYGYIEFKEEIPETQNLYKVKSFLEKPDNSLAKKIYNNDNFLWNTGIFLFNNRIHNLVFKDKFFNTYQTISLAIDNSKKIDDCIILNSDTFKTIMTNDPFDKMYLETAFSEAIVTKHDSNWYDCGSQTSIEYLKKVNLI